ncbi:Bifunctional dehydrogenase and ferrochelatase [Rhodotorula kratochvilovae]
MSPAPAGTVTADPLADPGPVPHPSLISPTAVPGSSAVPSAPSTSAAPADAPYEAPQPTGSLLLAFQTRKLSILLIGGGVVAASRLYHLLCAQPARIVVLAPENGTSDEVRWRLTSTDAAAVAGRAGIEVEWRAHALEREKVEQEIDGFDMVLTALDDAALSRAVYTACKARRVLVNVADVPPECDFYFGSVLRRGALSVMVSTNGKGPRVAARLRRRLEKALPPNAGAAIENVGLLRAALRKRENGGEKEVIERRMEWMIRVSDRWSLAQLGEMDARMREDVLEGWERGEAKGYWDVNRAKYAGLGWVASWFAKAGVGRCPVDRDPDGIGSTGFLLGVATTGAAVALWARR